jgi:hypothetical protein
MALGKGRKAKGARLKAKMLERILSLPWYTVIQGKVILPHGQQQTPKPLFIWE